jgi:hypothetical protein
MDEMPSGTPESFLNLSGVVQRTVIAGELPALVVVHDDEGDWLIGDGVNDPNEEGACGLFHFAHIIRVDPSLAEALNLQLGYAAYRETGGSPWEISRWEYED